MIDPAELERNRVVVQMAGAVAHKLKQPLAVAWGYLELLLDDPNVQLAPSTERYLQENYAEQVETVAYPGTTQAMDHVRDRQLDATLTDLMAARTYLPRYPNLRPVGEPVSGSFPAQFVRQPELQAIREEPDQRVLLRRLAAFSRATLDRAAPVQRVLRSAAWQRYAATSSACSPAGSAAALVGGTGCRRRVSASTTPMAASTAATMKVSSNAAAMAVWMKGLKMIW